MDQPTYQLYPCPQCGYSSSHVKLTGRDNMLGLEGLFYVSQCDGCGLLFQSPALKQDLLVRHYPDEYASYSVQEMRVGRASLWHLKHHKGYSHLPDEPPVTWLQRVWGKWESGMHLLPDYVPEGYLLEVACASGNRLDMLRRLGWSKCVGIEYSEYAARLSRKRGFEVYNGQVEDLMDSIPDKTLDVIIASFVMEHLRNPFQVTKSFVSKLRPGGQFIFSTLNVNSPDFMLYREYWYDLDLPRHFTFFRKRDLYAMLSGHFEIQGIYYQPAPQDYVGSARYRLKGKPHSLTNWFDQLMVRVGNRDELWPILYRACLLLALIGKATRICIHARRK